MQKETCLRLFIKVVVAEQKCYISVSQQSELAASLILPQTLNISNNFASYVSDIADSPNTPSMP